MQALTAERSRLEQNERGINTQVKDLTTSISQMESIKRKLGPVEERLEVGERVRDVIRDTRDRLVPLCRENIAQACAEHFRNMISDEFRDFSVEFDEDVQPMLRGPSGEMIAVTTLSGAQKRAFGLAFTLAIANASGSESPIVIDTPVGNMDSVYRKRILSYLAKSSPGQLIFLSHDEEISREYAHDLDPWVAERYLVDFAGQRGGSGVSTPNKGAYFTR